MEEPGFSLQRKDAAKLRNPAPQPAFQGFRRNIALVKHTLGRIRQAREPQDRLSSGNARFGVFQEGPPSWRLFLPHLFGRSKRWGAARSIPVSIPLPSRTGWCPESGRPIRRGRTAPNHPLERQINCRYRKVSFFIVFVSPTEKRIVGADAHIGPRFYEPKQTTNL